MLKKVRFLYLLLCAPVLSVIAIPEVDLPKEIPDEPFDIRAGKLEFANETVIASGGVTGIFENVTIHADKISGNTETGDLRVEGDILFERGNILWQGTDLEYNFMSQTGDFGPSTLNFDPMLMSVEQVERVSTNEFLLHDAEFTTCPREKDHRHFHVKAKEAKLIDEEYLIAKGVTVYLGDVPVFYVPYWRQKLKKSIFTFEAGFGSEWGAYLLVKATVPVARHVDWITDVNGYSRRGVGFGQGFAWNQPKAVGEFSAFYLNDQDPYTRYSTSDLNPTKSAIASEIGDDRYRFKFEHLQRFSDEHYFNTKLNYLSDPAVLEEFFKKEHRNNAQPENYVSWVYGNSYIGTEGFASHALNDFYSNIDRVEYSMDLYRSKIPGTPFYFQSENSISSLDKVVSNIDLSGAAAYDSARIDSANTVYMPQRYSFLSLVPRVGYRATYYSDTPGGTEEIRQIPGAGLEASFEAISVLSDRERWYGKGLRHKIEPYADYIYENSSMGTNGLHQFDSIDLLQDENKVKVGLRNILQTKRNKQVSRFIDLDVYTHYLVEDQGSGDGFDYLYLDARMPLTEKFMVDLLGLYDWNTDNVPFFNSRFSYDMNDVIISLEHLHRDNLNSLWTPRVDLFPHGKYSFEAYGRYEGNDNELEEIGFAGFMNWCCMRYGIGYRFYDEREHSIMFSIGLSAFPEARISSSL